MVIVGVRLKTLREGLNLSQQKMSEVIGSSQSNINRYEHGLAEPPFKILMWYADYFDVSLDYIFGRTDKPQGINYGNAPEVLKKRIAQGDEWNAFIEACFDPRSPMNKKLKEMMRSLAGGGDNQ